MNGFRLPTNACTSLGMIAVLTLAACDDGHLSTAATDPGPELDPGVYAVVSDDPVTHPSGARSFRVRILAIGVEGPVASIQGDLRTTSGLVVEEVRFGPGMAGDWHADEGAVRFAGIAVDGLPEEPAMVVRVAPGPGVSWDRSISAGDIAVGLTEVVTAASYRDVASQGRVEQLVLTESEARELDARSRR